MRTYAQKPDATQQAKSAESTKSDWTHFRQSHHEVNSILHLQRATGNQAVQRLLQPNPEALNEVPATTATRFAHNFSRIPAFASAHSNIQTKLKVNVPGDKYEQEADRVAEQVMGLPESQGGCPKCHPKQPGLQHERLQTKGVGSSESAQPATPPVVNEVLASPGQPLDLAARAFFEPRFGHDFSRVRVHSDAAAGQSARDVNAHAYTVGHNIVFGAGRYAPGTHQGRRLIAHELTHVIQQRAGSTVVQRKVDVDDFDVDEFDARTLQDYLAKIAGGKIEDHSDSDDKARLIVKQWRKGKRELKPEIKAVLIREMQSGFTGDDDERAILTLLLHSDDHSLEVIFAAIDPEDLDSDFQTEEEDELRAFYDRKFEGGRKAALQGSRKLRSQKASPQTDRATRRPSLSEALAEAGRVISSKATFGLAAGSQKGPDPSDSYDARYWKEEENFRSIGATVEPWVAMSQMVAHLGEPVPRQGGGTTHWRFDCFEGAEVVRLYADWRMLSRDEFNKKNTPLKIGFMAYLMETRPAYFERPVKVDKPGGEPHKEGAETLVRRPSGLYEAVIPKIPVGKPMAQVLDEAPVGSWIIWTNKDVTGKLADFAKRKAAGKTITDAEKSFIDRIKPWENENALKVGKDRYAAFPFGVVDEKTIQEGMANIVFRPNPVPAGYIAKNIYVSAVSVPK